MNKIKSLTQILVSAYLVRLMLTGADVGDALVILSLSALYGFHMYLDNKKEPEANRELKDKIAEVEKIAQQTQTKVSAMQLRR